MKVRPRVGVAVVAGELRECVWSEWEGKDKGWSEGEGKNDFHSFKKGFG